MSDYQLIVFDCDGTLVASEYANNLAICQTLEEEGITGYDVAYAYQHWMGNTLSHIFPTVEKETGKKLPADITQRTIANIQKLYDTELQFIAGAVETVERISQKYKICVASNGERGSVKKGLHLSGFGSFFDEDNIFTRIQVKNPKPAPDLLFLASDNMGVAPEHCLVIEDSATGAKGAIAADMDVWGFTGASHDPKNQKNTLLSVGVGGVYASLIHIAEKLGV